MWIVAKYKTKELETLKQSFSKIIGDAPEFYIPKIKQEYYINNKLKITQKNILSNKDFKSGNFNTNFLNQLM